MAFKSKVRHVFKGGPKKTNQAVNAIKSNADVNSSILTRWASNDAFGGEEQMKKVMKSVDKHRNPWRHDPKRKAGVEKLQNDIKITNEALGKEGLSDDMVKTLTGQRQQFEEALAAATSRRDGDPGLWGTTKDVGSGLWNTMNAGSTADVATKWGAVAGGYLALNGVGRAVTGGGVTYNSSGQRDIMGIPFI